MKKFRVLTYIVQYALIAFGSALYAAGFRFFLYANSIVTGGVTGIAMIINYLTQLPVGVLSIIMNIPLFIIAWRKFGLGFCVSSLVGMLVSSVMVDVFSLVDAKATSEVLLAAVYGGLIEGASLGLIYRAGATTGGVDIAAKLLRRKFAYINLGTCMLMLNVIVIAAFAVIFRRFDSAMYAILTMFISSKMIDLVLYGVSASKLCYIITDASETVKNSITAQLHRGVTLLHGEGAYSGKEKEVILCAVKHHQIVELRRIVRDIDANAFIIFTDAKEVFGNGFGDIMDNN